MSKLYQNELVDNTNRDSKRDSLSEMVPSKSRRENVAGQGAIPQKPE
jgi:hypothetical protein